MSKFSLTSVRSWLLGSVLGLFILPFDAIPAEQGSDLSELVVGETLKDFFYAAIDFSPRLQIAKEGLNIVQAREEQARALLKPQVNANANLTDNTRNSFTTFGSPVTDTFTGERLSISIQQILFNWQAFSARRRATQIVSQTEAEYFDELSILLADVANRYFLVLFAQDSITSLSSEIEAVTNQLNQIQSLFSLQLAQITDLRQAEASLASVQAQQLRLQAELAVAQERLRAITGIEIGDLHILSEETPLPEPNGDMLFWLETAARNNMQISAKRFALRAADESISETRGAYMPRVNLFATRQDSNVGFDNRFLGDTDNTFIGVDVSIPLYAGGANRARESEARAIRNIAESELRQTELETSTNIRSAFLQVQSSMLLNEAAERLVASTRLSSDAAREGFALGTVNTVDVLNTLRNQFQAERDLQQARYEQINFFLSLKREAGALTADDLEEISNLMVKPDS